MCAGPTNNSASAAANVAVNNQQEQDDQPAERVLTAGLFPPEDHDATIPSQVHPASVHEAHSPAGMPQTTQAQAQSPSHPSSRAAMPQPNHEPESPRSSTSSDAPADEHESGNYSMDETLFVFDWDDTLLPSTWLNRQGLRLDDGSQVEAWHREQLKTVEATAIELIQNAKRSGKVVLVTNAERGWIELSCQKFLPALLPLLENVKAVSARTSFETRKVSSPLDWKLLAFEKEIGTIYGMDKLSCPKTRKNVFSLGDSVHEREALIRATTDLPNCNAKSLKFVERPDITQICKQHNLVNSCFEKVLHHTGHLDLCIKCN